MRREWWMAWLAAVVLAGCASPERSAEEARATKLVEIKTQMGASYIQRNQLDIALQELEQALAIEPDNSQANNVMGLLQARLNNAAEAERYFRRAVEAQPANSEAHNNYGVFLCDRGRAEEAARHFSQALANPLYKTPELANLNAGTCLLRTGAPEQAVPYFKAALRINPKTPLALSGLARISHESGQHLSARGFLQRYFEIGPDSPEILLLAVQVEQALGNTEARRGYATRLRTKFPESPEARKLGRDGA